MPELDPRNSYVRARLALGAMIRQLREADKQLGDDEVSRQQHARNARDLADLIEWSETAQDLANADDMHRVEEDEQSTG